MTPNSLILPGKEADFEYHSKALAAAHWLQQKVADKAKAAFREMTPDQCRRFIRDADRISREAQYKESVSRFCDRILKSREPVSSSNLVAALDAMGRAARATLEAAEGGQL